MEVAVFQEECLRLRERLEEALEENRQLKLRQMSVIPDDEKDKALKIMEGENTEIAEAFKLKEAQAVELEGQLNEKTDLVEKLKKQIQTLRKA